MNHMASLVLDELNYPNPLLPINHNSQDNKNLIFFYYNNKSLF